MSRPGDSGKKTQRSFLLVMPSGEDIMKPITRKYADMKRIILTMIMLALGAPLLAAEVRFGTALEHFLQTELSAPCEDEVYFQNLRCLWYEDMRIARAVHNSALNDLSDAEMQELYACMERYLAAARTAYMAQLEYGLYSLSVVQAEKPTLYAATLARYRAALQWLYNRDRELLRADSMVVSGVSGAASSPEDAFTGAIRERASRSAWSGAAYRCFSASAYEVAEAQLKLKQRYLSRIISHEDDDLFILPELLSNYAYQAPQPEEYYSICRQKFDAAEKSWCTYAEQAAQLICPVRRWEGTDTGLFIQAQQMKLMKQHEIWYMMLLYGLQPS